MILADTSVWVDHFRRGDTSMRGALEANEICIHPMVIGELACGNLHSRAILSQLQRLQSAVVATNEEALVMIEQFGLMGRGIGFIDVHLLASAKLTNAFVWTRDKRLATLATEFGLSALIRGLH
ncbi:MAG: type II toxin-antitoxin system VapC family toxin [Casimicrobium sp.]